MSRTSLLGRLKDPFSCVSHGLGAVLAIIGAVVLAALSRSNPVALVAFLVYGAGLIFVYGASTLYHAVRSESPWLQRIDHMSIYVMIAGSYTPVCLLCLPRSYGIPMLTAEWTMAVFGLVLNIFFGGGPNWLRVVLYLAMGWLAIVAIGPLSQHMTHLQIQCLLAGGIVYTLGTVIYATERPRLWPGIFDAHDLWHLFVIAASGFHFALMMSMALTV
jgi:hemolysin III